MNIITDSSILICFTVTERGKAKSSRRNFFQHLKNEETLRASSNALDQDDMTNAATTMDSDILENEHVAALEQWDGEMNNQEEIGNCSYVKLGRN